MNICDPLFSRGSKGHKIYKVKATLKIWVLQYVDFSFVIIVKQLIAQSRYTATKR